MRVLLLSRYSDRASSHLRCFQYIPYLKQCGIEVTPAPLFGEYYLGALFDGRKRPVSRMIIDYMRRIYRLLTARNFDLLWLHIEAFPWLPPVAERLIKLHKIPYVLDCDDAWFHRYDSHPQPLVRRLLGQKIDWVMRNARLVVAGNNYTGEHARAAGARWVECLPTVIDLDDFPISPRPSNRVFTIGWLGSPSTARYLRDDRFRIALETVCADGGARVVLVGPGPVKLSGVPIESHEWTRETESDELHNFDVGVSPLQDGPFERGKCAFKVVQYMAAGRPSVVSPVGYHLELVTNGENGFFASTTQEWIDALKRLRENPELVRNVGQAARKLVEKGYCLQVCAPKLAQMFRIAAGGSDFDKDGRSALPIVTNGPTKMS
jgi:glycosyltransferase involved in cell wall biosynthesis